MSEVSTRHYLLGHGAGDEVAFDVERPMLGARELASVALLVEAELRARADYRAGASVMLLARDRALFAAGLLGAWAADLVVGLPPHASVEMVRTLRARPGVLTVLHDGEAERGLHLEALAQEALARPVDDALAHEQSARLRRLVEARVGEPLAERPVVDVFTSGSTGSPRVFRKVARQLLGETVLLGELFPAVRGVRVVSAVPAQHLYGLLFGVLLPLASKGAFVRQTVRSAEAFAATLRATQPGAVVSVPAHLRGLRHLPAGELPAAELVFSSGAPLASETADGLEEQAGWRVHEILGSTETGGFAWRRHSRERAERRYRTFPPVELETEGELLHLRSPFVDEPRELYRTADRVRVDADGLFVHLGRADGVVKIGGTRVSVREVEQRLSSIAGVEDVVVLPVEVGGSRGWALWAALVAPELDVKTVRRALREWLPPAGIPRRFRFVSKLPRTDAGKLTHAAVRALFEEKAS